MSRYPLHPLWSLMTGLRVERVVVDLDPVEVSDAIDHFPTVIEAYDADGKPRGCYHHRLAGMVWDAAEAEPGLTLDGPVAVAVGRRPVRVGPGWREAS